MERKNIIKKVSIGILILLAAFMLDRYLVSLKKLDAQCMSDRRKLLGFMNEAKETTDPVALTNLANSCRQFIDNCSRKELDSLQSFMSSFIKFTDDYCSDIANSLKDSGEVDTLVLLRPETKAEIGRVCNQCNYDVYSFSKPLYSAAAAAQSERDSMKAGGSPAEITTLFRNAILATQKKRDSLQYVFFNRVFASGN